MNVEYVSVWDGGAYTSKASIEVSEEGLKVKILEEYEHDPDNMGSLISQELIIDDNTIYLDDDFDGENILDEETIQEIKNLIEISNHNKVLIDDYNLTLMVENNEGSLDEHPGHFDISTNELITFGIDIKNIHSLLINDDTIIELNNEEIDQDTIKEITEAINNNYELNR